MSGWSDRLLTWACISVLLHTGCAPPLNDGQAARAFPGADSVAGSDHTPRQSDDCLLRLVTEIPFETYGNWFTVMAKAGNQNVRMLIDTGTSTSIELGLALMDKADLHILPDWQMILTPYGPIGYKSAILSTFMLGDIEKVNVEAALVADDDYIPDGINGLIGAAFLRKFDIEIDPANSRIRFYQVQGCRDGLVPFDEPYATTDMHMDQFNTPQIPITVNDVVLYAHLDTGSAHSFFHEEWRPPRRHVGESTEV